MSTRKPSTSSVPKKRDRNRPSEPAPHDRLEFTPQLRREIEDLLCLGFTRRQIHAKLSESYNHDLTQAKVDRWVWFTYNDWRSESEEDRPFVRERVSRWFEEIYREAMHAFASPKVDAPAEPGVTKVAGMTIVDKGDGVADVQGHGDPKLLAVAHKAADSMAKLWGAYEPTKIQVTGLVAGVDLTRLSTEDLRHLVDVTGRAIVKVDAPPAPAMPQVRPLIAAHDDEADE